LQPEAVTPRQAEVRLPQPADDLGGGLTRQEQLEQQGQPLLRFPVGVLQDRPQSLRTSPTGGDKANSPRLAFTSPALRWSRKGVQFHLGDLALEAQQQPPVDRGRIIDALVVAQQASRWPQVSSSEYQSAQLRASRVAS